MLPDNPDKWDRLYKKPPLVKRNRLAKTASIVKKSDVVLNPVKNKPERVFV